MTEQDKEPINQATLPQSSTALPLGTIVTGVAQIAFLNKSMPYGYRFEPEDSIGKVRECKEYRPSKKKKVIPPPIETNDLSDSPMKDDAALNSGGIPSSRDAQKRSTREKKPVVIEDLGYVDKERAKNSKTLAVENIKRCEKMLGTLKKHPFCLEPFLKMFEPSHQDYKLYMEKVKTPIDLLTVERKLKNGEYPNSYHLAMDIRMIWNNACTCFESNSVYSKKAIELSSYFEKLYKDNENIQLVIDQKGEIQELNKKVNRLNKIICEIENKPQLNSKPRGVFQEKPMNMNEKTALSNNIKRLNSEQLRGIIDIISDTVDINKSKEVLEFDIDSFPTRKCRELEKYVKQCLGNIGKLKGKELKKAVAQRNLKADTPPIPQAQPIKKQEAPQPAIAKSAAPSNTKIGEIDDESDDSSESDFFESSSKPQETKPQSAFPSQPIPQKQKLDSMWKQINSIHKQMINHNK